MCIGHDSKPPDIFRQPFPNAVDCVVLRYKFLASLSLNLGMFMESEDAMIGGQNLKAFLAFFNKIDVPESLDSIQLKRP